MAEYVLREGDTHTDVARRLLAEVDDPQAVVWAPRPDVFGGGVYVVNDEAAVAKVVADLQAKRDDEAKRISAAQAKADERDARADETGLTPAQLGFPANAGTDPGAPGTAGTLATDEAAHRGDGLLAPETAQTETVTNADGTVSEVNDEEVSDEAVTDDPATPEDESKMTPAQRRRAAREAKAKADAENVASTEGAAQEEVK